MLSPTVTISGRGILRQYNALRAQGYTTAWSGNGQICLKAPANYIDLYTEQGGDQRGWMARFRGPHAEDVIAVFGVDTLPTPFLCEVPYSRVVETVAQLNPDAQVSCLHRNTSSTPGVGVIVCGDCGMRW